MRNERFFKRTGLDDVDTFCLVRTDHQWADDMMGKRQPEHKSCQDTHDNECGDEPFWFHFVRLLGSL